MLRVNGLYGHIKRNDGRALVMLGAYLLALPLVGFAVLMVPVMMWSVGQDEVPTPLDILVRTGTPFLILGLAIVAFRAWRWSRGAELLPGCRAVTAREEPRLARIAAHVSATLGMPEPRLGVLEVRARNAFAVGLGARSAGVGVTRGLLQALDDDELAAVVASQLVRVREGDTRLMAVSGLMLRTILMLRRLNPLAIRRARWLLVFVLLPPLLLLFLFTGVASGLAGTLARTAFLLVSASRHLAADAQAVGVTHHPAALASALARMEGRSAVPGLDPALDGVMMDGAFDGEFATHPTIAERVEALRRHTGAMIDTGGAHRDTREAPWGQRSARGVRDALRNGGGGAARPAILSVDRANARVDEGVFGVPRVIGYGVVLVLVAMHFGLSMAFDHAAEAMGDTVGFAATDMPIPSRPSSSAPALPDGLGALRGTR